MKKAFLFTLCAAALGATLTFQSCDKIQSVVPITPIPFTGTADIVIPATAAGSNGTIGSTSVYFNIDSFIADQSAGSPLKITYDKITSVKITGMVLTLSDADATNSFGNFQTTGATFNTDANGGSLDPYTVVYIDDNPSTFSGMLDLPLADKDKNLKPYFASGKIMFFYAITGTLRTATTHDLHCHIDVTYDLEF